MRHLYLRVNLPSAQIVRCCHVMPGKDDGHDNIGDRYGQPTERKNRPNSCQMFCHIKPKSIYGQRFDDAHRKDGRQYTVQRTAKGTEVQFKDKEIDCIAPFLD